MRNVTSETVVNCLIEMTTKIGIPEELLTDNGSNFISKTMQKYCQITGIKQIRTSAYHPQIFNATLKQLLKKLTQSPGAQWDKCLPYILWAYRGTTHKTTGFSPDHLIFGRPMRMCLDQMVRYWQGKEERNECSRTEYIATLKVNRKLVKDMANERD